MAGPESVRLLIGRVIVYKHEIMSKTDNQVADPATHGLGFFDVLNDCLDGGLLCLDARGRILSATADAQQMLGLAAGQLVGHGPEVLPAPLADLIRTALQTDKPAAEHGVELRLPGPEPRVIRVRWVRPDHVLCQSGFIVLLNDLTAVRRWEPDLARLDRLTSIGTLSAGMAHEIKNALVAIKTFIELSPVSSANAELKALAQRELQRIESIISQMLKFAGPAEPRLAPVRLSEILDHSLRLARHPMAQKAIQLQQDFQAASDWVNGDECQLEQAFTNLILNAIEAMDHGGTLTLNLRQLEAGDGSDAPGDDAHPMRLCATVADTGVGVPAEHRHRMFEPFFTTKREGTGLGLAITRRIFEQHRAVVRLESEVNQGTTFHVCFTPLPPP